MQLNPIPKDSYGTFFKGDVYLIYNSYEIQPKMFSHHIHLWIGCDSSQVKALDFSSLRSTNGIIF